ncbi:type IV secretory system conjugative DNA transfer family protein, partial [Faecalibaculum rodentium]
MSRDKKKGGSVATFFRRVKSDKRKRGQLIGSLFVFVLAFSFGWQLVQVSRTGITNNLDLIMMAAENIFSVSVPQGADMQETISLCARNVISGLLVAVAAQLIYWACVMYSNLGRKNYRPGEEYGSAKKGQIIDAEQLAAQNNPDPDPEKRDPKNDIILSKQIRLDMDTWHTRLNNNIFVVGGSGSGKTRFFVKPNVLQLSSNYIVIDPKGSVAEETGHAFEEAGYEISYLNLVDFSKSMCWNPFVYFHSPEDVQNFVKNLIDNTSDKNQTGGDEFFTKAEITWLTAVIFYIMATAQGTGRCNMNTVMLMLDHSKAVEEDEDYKSEVDLMFEELEDEIRRRSDGR